jgi:hypothetical protein
MEPEFELITLNYDTKLNYHLFQNDDNFYKEVV